MSIKKNILLTGGRAPATLDLARHLGTAGHKVIVADSTHANLCRFSRFVESTQLVASPNTSPEKFIDQLLECIDQYNIDLLIPTCEEIFHIAEYKDRLVEATEIFCSDFSQLIELHHKGLFIALAKKHGLSVPETHTFGGDTPTENPPAPWEKSIFKPAYSRFGSEVLQVDQPNLKSSFERLDQSREWCQQVFIDGKNICTYSIVRNGKLLAHCCYTPIATAPGGASICMQSIHHNKALEWVCTFCSAINFTGQIAFDFIEKKDAKLFAIECNPRLTSGIHFFNERDQLAQILTQDNSLDGLMHAEENQVFMLKAAMRLYRKPIPENARDMLHHPNDKLPLLGQYLCLTILLLRALGKRISLTEATVFDIQWNAPTH